METLKAHPRRVASGFFDKYITGRGLDIGCGGDPLTPDCDTFEKDSPDNGIPNTTGTRYTGDANTLNNPLLIPESYDWVYSSHLIEHLTDPLTSLRAQYRLVKPGGFLIVVAPSRDHYEKQRMLPSKWNADHKSYWTLNEYDPPHTFSLSGVVLQALGVTGYWMLQESNLCIGGWDPVPFDEHSHGEYSLEVVIRKIR
jgi:SAM-dependent methyltransferase